MAQEPAGESLNRLRHHLDEARRGVAAIREVGGELRIPPEVEFLLNTTTEGRRYLAQQEAAKERLTRAQDRIADSLRDADKTLPQIAVSRAASQELSPVNRHSGLPTSIETELQERLDQLSVEGRGAIVGYEDLDNFKRTNEEIGHVHTDFILERIGDAAFEIVDEFAARGIEVLIAHPGGDEFVIVVVSDDPHVFLEVSKAFEDRAFEKVVELVKEDAGRNIPLVTELPAGFTIDEQAKSTAARYFSTSVGWASTRTSTGNKSALQAIKEADSALEILKDLRNLKELTRDIKGRTARALSSTGTQLSSKPRGYTRGVDTGSDYAMTVLAQPRQALEVGEKLLSQGHPWLLKAIGPMSTDKTSLGYKAACMDAAALGMIRQDLAINDIDHAIPDSVLATHPEHRWLLETVKSHDYSEPNARPVAGLRGPATDQTLAPKTVVFRSAQSTGRPAQPLELG